MESLEPLAPFLRNVPKQRRSKERLHVLLDTTAQLLCEIEPAQLTITAVAERSELPPGSVYEYVEDVSRLVVCVAIRGMEHTQENILSITPLSAERDDLRFLMKAALIQFAMELERSPGLAEALTYVESQPEFTHLPIESAKRNAQIVTRLVAPHSTLAVHDVFERSFMLVYLSFSMLKLAAALGGEEGERLVDNYVDMIHTSLLPLDGNPEPAKAPQR